MKQLKDYPESLVSKRELIEGSFVFSLWKNPELYGDYKNDIIAQEDFLTSDGMFYYTIGLQMYEKNFRSFDEASLLTFLSSNDRLLEGFNNRGGMNPINEIKAIINQSNVEGYFDELIKNNAILQLHDEGYAVEKYINKFEKMNYEQLEDFMEFKLNNVFLKSVSSGMTVTDLTSSYDSWIEKWDSGEGIGYKVGFPLLHYHLAGIHKKNLILHLGGIGQGKCQPLYSKIMTPDGYKEMRDMKIGSKVYGEDGKVHEVIGVYPQGKKDVYKITFTDGSSTVSCDEHLWNIQNAKQKSNGIWETKTLKEIMQEGYKKKNCNGNYVRNKFIPMTKPLEMESVELQLEPYILGLILGDGNITDSQVSLCLNLNEIDLIDTCVNYFTDNGFKITNKSNPKNKQCLEFRISDPTNDGNRLIDILKSLNLHGKKATDKFVPSIYKFNSIQNRIDILSGLIDSDGEVNGSRYTFSTISKELCDDVVFLVQSLGGTANIENRNTKYTYKDELRNGKPSFRIHIKLPNNIQAFKSNKHKCKFKIGQRESYRAIDNIEYIGKEEAQCIMVDNPTHLYLTDDMIVTHNTTSSLLFYVLPVLEEGEKICIIANEQDEEQFRQMILSTVLFNRINYRKFNRQKLLFGGFTEEDKTQLRTAAKWLEQFKDRLHFVHLTDYGTSNVKRIIKKYSKLGVGIFLFDTLKPTDESSDKAWAEFSETAKMLFQLAQKENIAILATAQLSSESSKRKYLDLSCIGKSRAIAETAGQVIMFRPMRSAEKKSLEVYSFKKVLNSEKKSKVIHELHEDKDYIIVFIPKNRYGQADIQIVYERNQSFNSLKEVGYCNVEFDGYDKK